MKKKSVFYYWWWMHAQLPSLQICIVMNFDLNFNGKIAVIYIATYRTLMLFNFFHYSLLLLTSAPCTLVDGLLFLSAFIFSTKHLCLCVCVKRWKQTKNTKQNQKSLHLIKKEEEENQIHNNFKKIEI